MIKLHVHRGDKRTAAVTKMQYFKYCNRQEISQYKDKHNMDHSKMETELADSVI